MYDAFTREYNYLSNILQTEIFLTDANGFTIKRLNGIWDTGANISAIDENIAKELNLISIGKSIQNTANGARETERYLLNVKFNDNVKFRVIALGANLKNIDFLVGMDIINQGNFSVSNFNGKTKVSFIIPSDKEIDYVKEINQQNKRMLKGLGRNSLCPCGSGKKVKDCCGKLYGV